MRLGTGAQGTNRSTKMKCKAVLDAPIIERYLVDDTYNLTRIAEHYGVSRQTIANRLKRMNRTDVNQRMLDKHNEYRTTNNQFKNYAGRAKAKELILLGWKPAAVMVACKVSSRVAYGLKNELKELL